MRISGIDFTLDSNRLSKKRRSMAQSNRESSVLIGEDEDTLKEELSLNLDPRVYILKSNTIKVYLKFLLIARDASNEGRGPLSKKHMTQCLTFLE